MIVLQLVERRFLMRPDLDRFHQLKHFHDKIQQPFHVRTSSWWELQLHTSISFVYGFGGSIWGNRSTTTSSSRQQITRTIAYTWSLRLRHDQAWRKSMERLSWSSANGWHWPWDNSTNNFLMHRPRKPVQACDTDKARRERERTRHHAAGQVRFHGPRVP